MLPEFFHIEAGNTLAIWDRAVQGVKNRSEARDCKNRISSELMCAERIGKFEAERTITFSFYKQQESCERFTQDLDRLFQIAPVVAMKHTTEMLHNYRGVYGEALNYLLEQTYVKAIGFLSDNPASEKSHPSELKARLGLWGALHNTSAGGFIQDDTEVFVSDLGHLQRAKGNGAALRIVNDLSATPVRATISASIAAVAYNTADANAKPALKR